MPQAVTGFLIKLGVSKLIATIAAVVINIGISIGANYLLTAIFGRQGTKPSDGQQNIRQAVGSRVRNYGIVHTGGQLTFLRSTNGTLGIVVTLGTGKEGAILEHRINDRVVTLAGGTVTEASYHGAIHIYTRDGSDDQTAIEELSAKFPEWTVDHRQRGCPHVAIICDPVKQKYWSEVFNGQIPVATQVRWGVHLYDPRKDSTAVIGAELDGTPILGTGTHRLNDPETWETSDNAALVIADYFAHPDGFGGGYDNVNWANIAREADFADDAELTVSGETIARWRLWASYKLASAERRQVMADLLKACDAGCWQDADLKFNLMLGRFEEPSVIITDDHIQGGTSFTQGPKAQQRVSAIKVLYTEAAVGYREQESATIADPDAEDDPNTDPQALEAYYAPHHNQATRLGKLALAKLNGKRWHAQPLVLNLYGLNLLGQRFCRVESEQLNIHAYFLIASGPKLNMASCTVEVGVDEVKPEDWDFDAATEEGTPPLAPGAPPATPDIAAPTGLALSAVQVALGDSNGVAIAASWDDPGRPDLSWEARYSPHAEEAWVPMQVDVDSLTARSGLVDSGIEYDVEVWAVTLLGRRGLSATGTITPAAAASVPAPSALSASGGAGAATVRVTMPVGGGFALVRVYHAASADFGSAVQVGGDITAGAGVVVEINDTGLSPGTEYYWAAAFGGSGDASTVLGPAPATIS